MQKKFQNDRLLNDNMQTKEHFLQRYKEETERANRYGGLFSLCLISLNKETKDILEKAKKILSANLRICDSYFKYGENKFILILSETDKKGTISLCKRILKMAKDADFEESVNINCGIVSYRIDSIDKNELLEKCENALENARERGNDQYFAFYPLTRFSVEIFQWLKKPAE